MTALDQIKKNLGVTESLDSDLNIKGTTQPVVTPSKSGSAIDALRANLSTPEVTQPIQQTSVRVRQ